jgi:hypothetical protein
MNRVADFAGGKALVPGDRTGTGWARSDIATAAMALSTGLGIQESLDPDAIPLDLFARAIDLLTASAPAPSRPGLERMAATASTEEQAPDP